MYKNFLILAKRLSEQQKQNITKSFKEGLTIDQLAIDYSCTKLTITRNLKKYLGEKSFKELNVIDKSPKKIKLKENKIDNVETFSDQKSLKNEQKDYLPSSAFMEIAPLDYEIDNVPQKDLSSLPISDVDFPSMVYMIVDKKIELETKYLKEYPNWQFLSQEELNRKSIEIHDDLKNAKRLCNKDQKVIKVPNTDVFKIVAPILVLRGISRIVIGDKLIAL